MNNSSSLSTITTSKVLNTYDKENKNDAKEDITINEKVTLTKNQYEVLKIICDTYQTSL